MMGPKGLSRPLISMLALAVLNSVALFGALDQDGVEVPIAETGSYTVVDFAASWCQPCYKMLPKLLEEVRKYPEIRFVVVDVDDAVEGRDQLVAALDLEIPVLWDEGHAIAERLRPEAMPATFVLDGEGQVVYQHSGSKDKDWQAFKRFISTLESIGSDE